MWGLKTGSMSVLPVFFLLERSVDFEILNEG